MRPGAKARGFTLIEILIVILIISIVTSVALMTLSLNKKKALEQFSNQLTSLIILAEEEAMLRPATLGLSINRHTLQFFIYQKDRWIALKDTTLSRLTIPDYAEVTLHIQNQLVTPKKDSPELVIPPNNDLTPFIILIGIKNETPYYQITGQANGEVGTHAYSDES